MKRSVIVLLLVVPWILHSMEPEEQTVELKQETVALSRPSWVRLVEEVLPGEFSPSSRISQVLAQEILRRKPQLREFILDKISLPFRDFELSETPSQSLHSLIKFNSTGDKMVTLFPRGLNTKRGVVEIWEVRTGKRLHDFRPCRVEFDPAGDKFIIFPGNEYASNAELWDSKTDKFITLKGHTGPAGSAVFNRDGDKVVTASGDGTAKICDVKTGKLLRTLKHETRWNEAIGWSVVLSRAGDKMATKSLDGAVMIWNIESGTLLHTLKDEAQPQPIAVGFNAIGDKLVTTGEWSNIGIWDLRTKKALLIPGKALIPGLPTMMRIPASDKVAIDTSTNPIHSDYIDIWDIETGKCNLYALPGQFAGFSPAGDKFVTLLSDEIIIWDVETGEELRLRHEHACQAVFNAAGDKVLAFTTSPTYANKRDRIRIWEVKTGKLLHIIGDDSNECWTAAFNPAGDKVAVQLGNKVRMFDLKPLFVSLEFLTEITPRIEITPTSITHRQVALLLDIYDMIERSKSPNASGEVSLAQRHCTFDFNNHPESIWDEYNALPEAIRRIFDPYILKLSSTREEQAPKRLKMIS